MPRDPSFDIPTPNFAGSSNLSSVPGSGPGTESSKVPVFQERKAITLCSGVLDQNELPIRIPRTRSPTPPHFLVPRGIFGPIYQTEPVSCRNSNPGPGRNTGRFVKSAQKYPRVSRNMWSGVSGTGNPNMKLVLV